MRFHIKKRYLIGIILIGALTIFCNKTIHSYIEEKDLKELRVKKVASYFGYDLDTKSSLKSNIRGYFIYLKTSVAGEERVISDYFSDYEMKPYKEAKRSPKERVDQFNKNFSEGGKFALYAEDIGYTEPLTVTEVEEDLDLVLKYYEEFRLICLDYYMDVADMVE